MRSTRDRFEKYIALEQEVMEKIGLLTQMGTDIVKVLPAPNRATYDRVLVMPGGSRTNLEIQITEAAAFEKYGDIRLDYISAFKYQGEKYRGLRFIRGASATDFEESVEILRWGKLVESEADTLAFYVPGRCLWLYSMGCLQAAAPYFALRYGLLINRKACEEWQSCFIAVPCDDERLERCSVEVWRAGADG